MFKPNKHGFYFNKWMFMDTIIPAIRLYAHNFTGPVLVKMEIFLNDYIKVFELRLKPTLSFSTRHDDYCE